MENNEILKRVANYATRKGLDMDWYPIQSADQNNGDTAIVLDWNRVSNRLYSVLEDRFDLYYGDDMASCSECGKLINTMPHSYFWQPNYLQDDSGIYCLDCIYDAETFESVLDYYVNNPRVALMARFTDWLLELRFEKINTDAYRNGLHRGMDDNPESILNNWLFNIEDMESHNKRESVFVISETSQFYIEFDLYSRIPE